MLSKSIYRSESQKTTADYQLVAQLSSKGPERLFTQAICLLPQILNAKLNVYLIKSKTQYFQYSLTANTNKHFLYKHCHDTDWFYKLSFHYITTKLHSQYYIPNLAVQKTRGKIT